MILSLILWYVSAAGLAVVVGHSAVTVGFRRWLNPTRPSDGVLDHPPPFPGAMLLCSLLECPMCLGVWEGGIAAAIGLVHTPYPFAISVAVLALSTSAVNFAYGRLTGVI